MNYSKYDFDNVLSQDTHDINDWLSALLPSAEGDLALINEAMRYSVFAGGKRVRPILMLEAYRLFGGDGREIRFFCSAIECIHTYSLVHDDLPAMDNDMLRRGKPTTHAKFGEANGILCGDALLNFAFELAIKGSRNALNPSFCIKAMTVLAEKAGGNGMIGGQVLDLKAEGKTELSLEELLRIHSLKTSALIEASLMIGAILAGADDETVIRMKECAYHIGLAFQIQDDILDIIGDEDLIGKPVGSDERNDKRTYPGIVGLEKAKEDVEMHTNAAASIIRNYTKQDSFLEDLIRELALRNF